MEPLKQDLLDLLNEFTDFLWDNAEWWTDENGKFADGNKIPDSRIDDMNRSLWKH